MIRARAGHVNGPSIHPRMRVEPSLAGLQRHRESLGQMLLQEVSKPKCLCPWAQGGAAKRFPIGLGANGLGCVKNISLPLGRCVTILARPYISCTADMKIDE